VEIDGQPADDQVINFALIQFLKYILIVKGRGVDYRVRSVLLVLTAPDQLRVQIAVAALVLFVKASCPPIIGNPQRPFDFLGLSGFCDGTIGAFMARLRTST